MTNQNTKTVVQSYYEQFGDDPSVADAIFAPAYVQAPHLSLGPNGVREEREMVLRKSLEIPPSLMSYSLPTMYITLA